MASKCICLSGISVSVLYAGKLRAAEADCQAYISAARTGTMRIFRHYPVPGKHLHRPGAPGHGQQSSGSGLRKACEHHHSRSEGGASWGKGDGFLSGSLSQRRPEKRFPSGLLRR